MAAVSDADLARMASTVPADFISLQEAQTRNIGSFCNVIGVVTDYMPPRTTAKNEWQVTMRLTDHTLVGLQIAFFNVTQDQVPEARNGDVIIAEGVKVNSFRGERQLLSARSRTDWTVIPLTGIIRPWQRKSVCQGDGALRHRCSTAADPPTLHQQQWAITLAHSRNQAVAHSTVQIEENSTTSRNQADQSVPPVCDKKFSLIKDLREQKFHNITGQVIKIIQAGSSAHGDIVDVHLTDYTSHVRLHDYQPSTAQDRNVDRYAWSGPYGQYTIKIECHEPHGSWVLSNVKPGQIACVQNVRVKLNRDASFMEGNIFADQRYPDKICAFKPLMNSREVLDLLARRNSYQARAVKNGQTNLLRVRDKDGKELPDKFQAQNSDSKKKKPKKAVKRKIDDEAKVESSRDFVRRLMDPNLNPSVGITPRADVTGLCKMGDIIDNPTRVLKINGLMRNLPFVNCRYKLQMRVVDFYPHNIQDFCVYKNVRSGDMMEMKWVWAFYLAVQAANESHDAHKDHLLVEVSHKEANLFLNIRPTDLRAKDNSELYTQLIRKLRLLWGDLDEVKQGYFASYKQDPNSFEHLIYGESLVVQGNRPFQGCIEEFGMPYSPQSDVDGARDDSLVEWQRHYKLCETIIT